MGKTNLNQQEIYEAVRESNTMTNQNHFLFLLPIILMYEIYMQGYDLYMHATVVLIFIFK